MNDSTVLPSYDLLQANAKLANNVRNLVSTLRFVVDDLNSTLDYETRIIMQDAIDKAEGK